MATNILAQMTIALGADASGVAKGIAVAKKNLAGLVKYGENLQGLGQQMSLAFSLPMGAMAGFGLKLAAEMEQSEVAFTTLTGSAEQAKKTLGELKQFAATTPFEFPELQDAAKKLIAFGISADDSVAKLKQVGDIAAGIGAPVGEIAEIFGKAKVQGRLFGEDINQLLGRGIPVIQEFAKQLGVSESEVKSMVSEGKISFANLEQAFADLTAEGGKFGGLMAAQSQTLGGVFSTLADNAKMALADMAADMSEAFDLKGIVSSVSEIIGRIAEGFRSLSPEVKRVIFVVGGLVAAIGPLLGIIGAIMTALPALTAAFAVLTGPIGLIGLAVAGAVFLIIKYWDEIKAYFTSGGGAGVFTKVKDVAVKAFAVLKAAVTAFVKIGMALWDRFGGAIVAQAKFAWDTVMSVVGGALDVLSALLDVFKNIWEGNWSALWDSVLNYGKVVVNAIIDLIAGVITAIPRMLNGVLKGLGIDNAITKGLDKSLAAVRSFVEKVKFETKELPSLLAPAGSATAGAATTTTTSTTPSLPTGGESKTSEVLKELAKDFDLANNKAKVFGDFQEAAADKSKALESAISSLLANGISPQSALIQKLYGQMQGLNNLDLSPLSNTFETFAASGVTALDSINARLDAFKAKTVEVYENVSVSTTRFMEEQAAMAMASVEMVSSMAGMVEGAIEGSLTAIGEVMGNALAGVSMSAGSIVSAILMPFADMAVQLGTYAISMGIGIEAIKASLASMTGVGAIAAGIALVALGTAAKSFLGGMSKKGAAAPSIPKGGGGTMQPRTTSSSQPKGPNEIKFRIEGRDLVSITNQESAFTKRVGGR